MDRKTHRLTDWFEQLVARTGEAMPHKWRGFEDIDSWLNQTKK
jgi:hypothetical protein